MSEPFIGQIMMFAGNFAPRGWAFCQGQLLSIAQNTALFSILGTTYGGNGQTTFGLPDLRGRVALGTGQGPGLPNVVMGELAGTPNVTLTVNQMPMHNHTAVVQVNASDAAGTLATAAGNVMGVPSSAGDPVPPYAVGTSAVSPLAPSSAQATIGVAGGSQPVGIMPPYLGINYIIALEGIFPSRN